MKNHSTIIALASTSLATAQAGALKPLAYRCNPLLPRVVCIDSYAAAMPYPFNRPFSTDLEHTYDFTNTVVANATSLRMVYSSEFIVFDQKRGMEILGSNPSYEALWNDTAQLEGTTYVPEQNKVYTMRVRELSWKTSLTRPKLT